MLRKFLGIAKVTGTDRTSTTVFAKILGRADHFDKFFSIGFYKSLLFEGA